MEALMNATAVINRIHRRCWAHRSRIEPVNPIIGIIRSSDGHRPTSESSSGQTGNFPHGFHIEYHDAVLNMMMLADIIFLV